MNKIWEFVKKLDSFEVRIVRIHLAIFGYFTLCASSKFLGIVPWEEALLFDKVISTASIVFVIQGILAYGSDMPVKLKWVYFFTIVFFIWFHKNL